MGIRAKDIERGSMLGQFASHPFLWIPPNDIDYYTLAALGNTLTVGLALTMNATRSWGGASSVNFSAAAAGGGNNATVTVFVTGRDENHEPVTETIVLAGGGSVNVITASGTQLFSSVDSATITAISGSPPAVNYSVGIGSGQANDQVRVPSPYRGIVLPAAPNNTMVLAAIGANLPANNLVATSVAPRHEQLLVTLGIVNQVRIAAVGIHGQDPRTFMEL